MFSKYVCGKETVFLVQKLKFVNLCLPIMIKSMVSFRLLSFARHLTELLSGVFPDPGQPVVDPGEAKLTVKSQDLLMWWWCSGVVL